MTKNNQQERKNGEKAEIKYDANSDRPRKLTDQGDLGRSVRVQGRQAVRKPNDLGEQNNDRQPDHVPQEKHTRTQGRRELREQKDQSDQYKERSKSYVHPALPENTRVKGRKESRKKCYMRDLNRGVSASNASDQRNLERLKESASVQGQRETEHQEPRELSDSQDQEQLREQVEENQNGRRLRYFTASSDLREGRFFSDPRLPSDSSYEQGHSSDSRDSHRLSPEPKRDSYLWRNSRFFSDPRLASDPSEPRSSEPTHSHTEEYSSQAYSSDTDTPSSCSTYLSGGC